MRARRKLPARRSLVIGVLAAALAAGLAGTVAAQLQLPGTALTTDPGQDLRAAFSPDGQQIAFQSSRAGSYDILLMDGDGGNQRFLTQDLPDDRRPAWSPDGAWIAFDSDRSGSRDVWAVEVAGGGLIQITTGAGQETFPSFSPDGKQLAYFGYEGGQMDLWVVELNGVLTGSGTPAAQRVTTGMADERSNQCTFACHSAGWSPDGRQLAYTAANNTQVWLVGVDGSDPRQVGGGGAMEHFPHWTADGRIVFLSERVTEQRDPVNDVWVMDADGGNLSLLFKAVPHGGPLEFRLDSSTVIFHSPRGGNFDLYTTVLGQGQAQVVATAVATVAPGGTAVAEPTVAELATAVEAPATVAGLAATAEPASGGGGGGLGWVWVGLGALGVVLAGGLALFLFRRARPA